MNHFDHRNSVKVVSITQLAGNSYHFHPVETGVQHSKLCSIKQSPPSHINIQIAYLKSMAQAGLPFC